MQTYENHVHKPVLWVTGVLFWLVAVVLYALAWAGYATRGFAEGATLLALAVSLTIGRVYITALQDRIIKLEMRLRCARLLTGAQMAEFARLSKPQLVALRFASDEELPGLMERALRENMTSDAIKRAVTGWVPDLDRT
jgi:hypothetical protein